jgi:hypothetical protein
MNSFINTDATRVVYLVLLNNKTYVIYNLNMTKFKNTNETTTQNITEIPVYTHFLYSRYPIDLTNKLLMNTTEFKKWADQVENTNKSTSNNIIANIKTLTNKLFKSGNDFILDNKSNIIISFQYNDPSKIISNNIPDQYFINSINNQEQYTKYQTLRKELQELSTKLEDIPNYTSSYMDEIIKSAYPKKNELLYISNELNFKEALTSDLTKDLTTICKFGDLSDNIASTTDTDSIDSLYIRNKYYYTYKETAKTLLKIWELYKNNKKNPDKNSITSLIHSVFSDTSSNKQSMAENNIQDEITKLSQSNDTHYKIIILYYLLDYILILKLLESYISKNGFISITLSDILTPNSINVNDKMFTKLRNLYINSRDSSNINIPTILQNEDIINTISYTSDPPERLPVFEFPEIEKEIVTEHILKVPINNTNLFEKLYLLDIIYIRINSLPDTTPVGFSNIISNIISWIVQHYNAITTNMANKITKDNFKSKFDKITIDKEISNITDVKTIRKRINYIISLSKYIHYFQTNLGNVIKYNSTIYNKTLSVNENTTVTEYNKILKDISKSLKQIKSMRININLNIDKLYDASLDTTLESSLDQLIQYYKQPEPKTDMESTKDEILPSDTLELKCTSNNISDISPMSNNIYVIKSYLNRLSSSRSYESYSLNMIYLIWQFNKLSGSPPPSSTKTSELSNCTLSNLLMKDSTDNKLIMYSPIPNVETPTDDTHYIHISNTLVTERSKPDTEFYKINTVININKDTRNFNLYVTDGYVNYMYDIKNLTDPINTALIQDNAILSKYDLLSNIFGTKYNSKNNEPIYVRLLLKTKVDCVAAKQKLDNEIKDQIQKNPILYGVHEAYHKIKENMNNNNNSTITKSNTSQPIISQPTPPQQTSTSVVKPTQVGGGNNNNNNKTHKNKKNSLKIFIERNLSIINAFVLYITNYVRNEISDNGITYKLCNISLNIFIQFQHLLNNINNHKYNNPDKYIKFIEFYKNNILNPINIIKYIYDICNLLITDISFIDKLYNKMIQISKTSIFKELKTMNNNKYTLKYK